MADKNRNVSNVSVKASTPKQGTTPSGTPQQGTTPSGTPKQGTTPSGTPKLGATPSTSKEGPNIRRIQVVNVDKPLAEVKRASPSATRNASTASAGDGQPEDLMISYSHADRDMMLRLREALEANGLTVWVDTSGLRSGVDFLSKIGQAIIDAKTFVTLLSTNSIKSKFCQDELALAYVSNKAVFPVSMQPPDVLFPLMSTGERLQLAGLQWISLVNEDEVDANLQELSRLIREEITDRESVQTNPPPSPEKPKERARTARQNLNKRRRYQKPEDDLVTAMPTKYWNDRYSGGNVRWEKFVEDFLSVFKDALSKLYSEDDQIWLVSVLRREMEVGPDELLGMDMFIDFCSVDGEEQPVWQRVMDQARESSAMKEVFNMESDVRVTAIENLGKLRSAAVIDALRDLLTDPDANVRAVAAVSLARTNANDPGSMKDIMSCLIDKDRLVREAGCLALGHLKAQVAITKILHMWRNDVISNVREAAAVALKKIGGPRVEKEMHLTTVLAGEIRQLTQE